MKKIKVYTADSCPYCVRAKQLLTGRGLVFEEVKIGWDDAAAWEVLAKRTGMKTVPQIFFAEDCIGGYTELAALDASGMLQDKLKD